MALNTEIILTLRQLKGFGTKTIINISKTDKDISTIEKLCLFWKTLKGKRFESISSEDLYSANKAALRVLDACQRENIGIISYDEPLFPTMLRNCINEEGKEDPAILLYYRGNIDALQKPGIAVIGTREPTPNGIKAGNFFSAEFAKQGFNIVSGLAIGCDTTGHEGALSVGGTTTAFLANGLDWNSIYPKENLELAKRIVENGGLLLSEYPIGQACNRYSLVARDRLQAGLSYATIAIQTGIKGGTMHAVRTTLQAHKPLFMVKFKSAEDNNHEKVQGNNQLISEGKAFPLGSETLTEAIERARESIKNPSVTQVQGRFF